MFVSNKMFWTFIVVVLACQATDCYLAFHMLSPELEWNPIARFLWDNYGFGGLLLFKFTALAIGLTAMGFINNLAPQLAKWMMIIFMIICAIPLILYTLI